LSTLPRVSGREVVHTLLKLGYEFNRQHGSHIIMRHHDPPHRRIVVPNHSEIAKGTLRSIIRQAGLTLGQFAALLIEATPPDQGAIGFEHYA
jgi:predicted RNA binding protein YcfA (HicA-like mRNA interferase family)